MRSRYIQLIAAALLVGLAVYGATKLAESSVVTDVVAQWGYLGIVLVATVNSFNIVLPVPVIAFFPLFLASGLAGWAVVVAVSIGMTAGDALGYWLGNAGRKIFDMEHISGAFTRKIESFKERSRVLPFMLLGLYVCLVPAPNELIVIPMAFAGYQLRYMLPIILAGNVVFNALSALGVLAVVGLL